jgi:hypothetical protein
MIPTIPEELRVLVAERRVIPFVGPEVSAAAGLPDWDAVLRRTVQESGIAFDDDELDQVDNPLQVGEYVLQRHGGKIGPLRHAIEQSVRMSVDPRRSAPHVELVNLGAAVTYTTNCDDLVESTFRALGAPVHVVALAEDVAGAGPGQTEVVKYHGDLRYESTLVLTESAFFERLALESALDVKLRSDLLGRGILFLGYGNEDSRLRLIWSQLARRARQTATEDLPPSFVVRLRGNRVLERVDHAAGLRTIVLDPAGRADTVEARAELLAEFLYDLAAEASPDSTIVGSDQPMFLSTALVRRVTDAISDAERASTGEHVGTRASTEPLLTRELLRLVPRCVPDGIEDDLLSLYQRIIGVDPSGVFVGFDDLRLRAVLKLAARFGASALLTDLVAWNLVNASHRHVLLDNSDTDWMIIWGAHLDDQDALEYLARFAREIRLHEEGCGDDDIAYAADLARRIELGQIVHREAPMRSQAAELLQRAAVLYPSILGLDSRSDAGPDVHAIIDEIEVRRVRERDTQQQGSRPPGTQALSNGDVANRAALRALDPDFERGWPAK